MSSGDRRTRGYIPHRGDAVWWTFDNRVGHEQAGRRPALVISPHSYNGRSGLAIICPVTSKTKGYPFDVPIPDGLAISGVIQTDQLRSADWRSRDVSRICSVPRELMDAVTTRIAPLIMGD